MANILQAMVLRSYYPVSGLYRVVNDDIGLQLDFMSSMHGVGSFASLRSRSVVMRISGAELLVASLVDIINSKKELGRAKDIAVLPVLQDTLRLSSAAAGANSPKAEH